MLELRKTPMEITDVVNELRKNKIKYVPFYNFSFENLREEMCVEYDFYADRNGKSVSRWYVTDDNAVPILINAGAVVTRRRVDAGDYPG